MILTALLVGIYAYIIFLLGIFGLLYPSFITNFTFIFFIISLLILSPKFKTSRIPPITLDLNIVLLVLFLIECLIALFAALGPETAFDALWYHLTLPKLYLVNHSLYHIPGGLLYYSDMPKLGELLYIGALAGGNEITAKIIHFIFGVLCAGVIYKIARNYMSLTFSFLAVIIFYSNLVVMWESTTAYVDLIRAFFEVVSLYAFLIWYKTKQVRMFLFSALLTGLAISVKLIALGSLIIYALLILLLLRKQIVKAVKYLTVYILVAILIPFPWFLFSYLNTGNPVYPFFTGTYPVPLPELNVITFFVSLWNLLIHSSDPLSPLYLMIIPFLVWVFPKCKRDIKILVIYSVLALFVWYITPQTGGGRFIIAYLPAFSVVCAAVVAILSKENKILYKFLIIVVIFISLLSIGYRSVATMRYIPYLLGKESKQDFLSNNLNFNYGDFYDTDGYFAMNITPQDTVLLYGFHNLYYVNFPYIDSSWVKKGDRFTYIAVQNTSLPPQYSNWELVYTNSKTLVKLYRAPEGSSCTKVCVY